MRRRCVRSRLWICSRDRFLRKEKGKKVNQGIEVSVIMKAIEHKVESGIESYRYILSSL